MQGGGAFAQQARGLEVGADEFLHCRRSILAAEHEQVVADRRWLLTLRVERPSTVVIAAQRIERHQPGILGIADEAIDDGEAEAVAVRGEVFQRAGQRGHIRGSPSRSRNRPISRSGLIPTSSPAEQLQHEFVAVQHRGIALFDLTERRRAAARHRPGYAAKRRCASLPRRLGCLCSAARGWPVPTGPDERADWLRPSCSTPRRAARHCQLGENEVRRTLANPLRPLRRLRRPAARNTAPGHLARSPRAPASGSRPCPCLRPAPERLPGGCAA